MYFAPLCGCYFLNSKKAQKHFYSEDMDKLRELRKKYSFFYFRKNIGNTKLFYILKLLPNVLGGDSQSSTFTLLSDAILKSRQFANIGEAGSQLEIRRQGEY